MPRKKMDYSNTIIYKIFCRNPNIKEIYIGHTTNFVNRKSSHKTSCKNSNVYIYRYIREHGGWDNWKILILDDIDCKNYEEARKAEQSYIEQYNSELNSSTAYCIKDEDNTHEKKENIEKKEKEHRCQICSFTTCKKTDYERHLLTDKHKKNFKDCATIKNKEFIDDKRFICKCGKTYKYKQGLWVHRQKCPVEDIYAGEEEQCIEITEYNNKPIISHELVLEIVKKQETSDKIIKEQQNQIQTLCDAVVQATNTINQLTPQLGNNNTHNSHNTTTNQFNINVFLNEQCKDAINMSDFIKSIEVSLEQLDFTKTNGLEKGISNVIMENMNKLSLYERPIHCTDAKREILYIKDNNTWEKDKDKKMIKQAIKRTSNKNYTALTNWTKANPNFMKDDDKQMFYAKAISNMGKPMDGIDDKIVKKLCCETNVKDNLYFTPPDHLNV